MLLRRVYPLQCYSLKPYIQNRFYLLDVCSQHHCIVSDCHYERWSPLIACKHVTLTEAFTDLKLLHIICFLPNRHFFFRVFLLLSSLCHSQSLELSLFRHCNSHSPMRLSDRLNRWGFFNSRVDRSFNRLWVRKLSLKELFD